MLLTGLVTISAFVMLAVAAAKRERSALLMAGGLLLLVVSVGLHVVRFESVMATVTALTAEVGIGLWMMAGIMARHRKQARPFFWMGSMAMLAAVVLFGMRQFSSSRSNIPNETTLLVELGPDDSIDELEGTLGRFGARAERAFPTVSLAMDENLAQVYLVTASRSEVLHLLEQLRRDTENVDHIEANSTLAFLYPVPGTGTTTHAADVMENDPLVSQQWALDAIRGHEAHAMLRDLTPERKARLAVLDTGVDGVHEDLGGVFRKSPSSVDRHGHGSHVAGIAGAATNNGIGIASLNWEGRFVDVSGYQALGDNGMGSIEQIAQAIIDAANDDMDVISMSLGAKAETPKTIRDAIQFAMRNDVIVLASAGNANEDAIDHMPSNVPGVIVVSAVDENLAKARFSNTNTSLGRPITAPGVNILSLKTGGGYVEMSGTSMSTPVVSGLVAVMRALDPDISDEQVYKILEATGRDVADTKRIGKLIDAGAAIQAVLDGR